MNDNDFEKKLSKLSLTRPSEDYTRKAHESLRHLKNRPVWTQRLNYVLGICLTISFGINLLQLNSQEDELQTLSTNCQINSLGRSNQNEPSPFMPTQLIEQQRDSLNSQLHLNYTPQYC